MLVAQVAALYALTSTIAVDPALHVALRLGS